MRLANLTGGQGSALGEAIRAERKKPRIITDDDAREQRFAAFARGG